MRIAVLDQSPLPTKFNMLCRVLKIFFLIQCFYLYGCVTTTSIPSPHTRAKCISQLAKSVSWKEHTIHTDPFILKAYGKPIQSKNEILTIYIEGDGLAWIADDMLSDNPTPIDPIGLKMAVRDQKNSSIAYLARPCQGVFNQDNVCKSDYWGNLRFSPIVIRSMNQGVDYLKKYYQAKKIIFIGYSGGGTVAALLTAKRKDVVKLITVAAVLDIHEWVNQKSLTPLYGSLDPATFSQDLISTPQTHWIGGKDKIVPKEVAFAFADHFPLRNKPRIIVIPNFDHVCCWSTDWTPA